MKADFDLIFDDCLKRLQAGYSLEDCLSEYPEQAEGLRPLLAMALEVSRLPSFEVRPEPFQAGRQRLIEALGAATQETETLAVSPGRFSRYAEQVQTFVHVKIVAKAATIFARKESVNMKLVLSVVLSLAVVLVTLVTTVGNVSAASLPGDPLYPMKRVQEDMKLLFASGEARQQLEDRFLQERHDEVKALIGLKRSVVFEFVADVEAIGPEKWLVGGFTLAVNKNTSLDETLAVGEAARARIQVEPGVGLVALSIREARPTGKPKSSKTPTPAISSTPTPAPNMTDTPIPGPTDTPTSKPPRFTKTPRNTRTATPSPVPSNTVIPSAIPITDTPTPWIVTNTPTEVDDTDVPSRTATPTATSFSVTNSPTPFLVTTTPTPFSVTNSPTPFLITASPTPFSVTNSPTPLSITSTPIPGGD